jgi:hypothetical protein
VTIPRDIGNIATRSAAEVEQFTHEYAPLHGVGPAGRPRQRDPRHPRGGRKIPHGP